MKTRALLSLTLISAALSLLALLGGEMEFAPILSATTLFFCLISWFALLFMTRKKSQAAALQASLTREIEHMKQQLDASQSQETKIRHELEGARAESQSLRVGYAEKLNEVQRRQEATLTELHTLRAQLAQGESHSGRDASDTAVLQFLRSLQERGRLLDFAMADINRLPDAQVGAAARVVHQGVKVVLQDYFDIQAISQEEEGSLVAIPRDDSSELQKYRILSRDALDSSHERGKLLHRGWEALSVRLPQSMPRAGASARIIAPAEIDAQGPRA